MDNDLDIMIMEQPSPSNQSRKKLKFEDSAEVTILNPEKPNTSIIPVMTIPDDMEIGNSSKSGNESQAVPSQNCHPLLNIKEEKFQPTCVPKLEVKKEEGDCFIMKEPKSIIKKLPSGTDEIEIVDLDNDKNQNESKMQKESPTFNDSHLTNGKCLQDSQITSDGKANGFLKKEVGDKLASQPFESRNMEADSSVLRQIMPKPDNSKNDGVSITTPVPITNKENSVSTNKVSSQNTSIKNEKPMSGSLAKQDQMSGGKIPQSATEQIIGQFLEYTCPIEKVFSYNAKRIKHAPTNSRKIEQSKTEISLYYSSVKNSPEFCLGMNALNSLNPSNQKGGDKNEGASNLESSDIDRVINSLVWLRLAITTIHYPEAELIGDMLSRYVVQCTAPKVQAQALSVAQFVFTMRPPDGTPVTCQYYTKVLQVLTAKSCRLSEVTIGEMLFLLINLICKLLNISTDDASGSCISADSAKSVNKASLKHSLSFEVWQYQNNLLELLNFITSLLHQDLHQWKKR